MIEELSHLLELQVQDREVDRLRRRADAIPRDIEKAEGDIEAGQVEVALRKKELEASKKKRRDSEHEIERLDGEIKKLQSQQFLLKTNKDFSAMTREIDVLKEKRSDLETQVLLILDAEEEVVGAVRRAEKELEEAQAKASAERSRLEGILAEVNAELARALEVRNATSKRLPADLKSRYERIRDVKQGTAVVPIVKNSCGGCFTALPPQRINDVKMGARIVACEACGRLLVWTGDGAEAA